MPCLHTAGVCVCVRLTAGGQQQQQQHRTDRQCVASHTVTSLLPHSLCCAYVGVPMLCCAGLNTYLNQVHPLFPPTYICGELHLDSEKAAEACRRLAKAAGLSDAVIGGIKVKP